MESVCICVCVRFAFGLMLFYAVLLWQNFPHKYATDSNFVWSHATSTKHFEANNCMHVFVYMSA